MSDKLDYLDPEKRSVWDRLRLFVSCAKERDTTYLTPADAVAILTVEAQLTEARAVLNVIQVRGSAGACPACHEFADDSESDAKGDRHVDWDYGDAKNVRALKGHAPDCRLAKCLEGT